MGLKLHAMLTFFRARAVFLLTLAACALAAALVVWLAPEERTLGAGIKWVYVHVALVWTGLTGLALTGVLGAAWVALGGARFAPWAKTAGWVACAFFAAGLAMSVITARINWGGISWQEPRMAASLRALAAAVIVFGVAGWFGGARWVGALYVLPAVFVALTVPGARLVLHPQNAVMTSTSLGIQAAFLTLFALFGMAALGAVVYFADRRQPTADD